MTVSSVTQRSMSQMVARVFLTIAWRSFAATQCRALPCDLEGGLAEVLTANKRDQ